MIKIARKKFKECACHDVAVPVTID